MKKIILIFILCLCIVGCGTNKKQEITNENKDSKIDLKLGISDMTFKENITTCGDKQIQSTVTFNQDKTVSYELYECQNDNVILEKSNGTYSTNNLDITVTNTYEEKLFFEIIANDKIALKINNRTTKTFTK